MITMLCTILCITFFFLNEGKEHGRMVAVVMDSNVQLNTSKRKKCSGVSVPLGNLFHFIYPSIIADASISESTCNLVKYLMKVIRPAQEGNSLWPLPFHLS